jgi:pimeloyl-ACP methyl ester carboxylesterase
LAGAGVALYLTVCLLFYQGQWQFTFSPPGDAGSRPKVSTDSMASSLARRTGPAPRTSPASAAAVAASSGLPITEEHFDTTEEGVELLDGWWIPAHAETASGPQPSSTVILFCHNGQSDLAGNIDALQAFHALGVSVFAFDYRGFGASQPGHPSQRKAYEDGMAALRYLTNTRHIAAGHIVIYGAEVGAAVAVHVAYQAPQIAGLILENPQPSLAKQVRREQHIHVLPMWLIFPDRFEIARLIPSLRMPKLVIATNAEPEYGAGAQTIYREAVAPKQTVRMETNVTPLYTQAAWRQAVQRFLESLPARSR